MSMDGWEQKWFERLVDRVKALEARVSFLEGKDNKLGPTPEIEELEIKERKKAGAEIVGGVVAQHRAEASQNIPPVDHSARQLLDGSPVPADRSHTEIRSDGMQKSYVVLSPEERAKGFVRPLRASYIHVGVGGSEIDSNNPSRHGRKPPGCGTLTKMGRALVETYARDPKFYDGTFCAGGRKHFPLDQFVWADTNEVVGS